jgi:hypothetical protein
MATLLYKGVPSNPENGLRVRLGYEVFNLSDHLTLTNQNAQFLSITPDTARNITMPSEAASQGSFFFIKNESASHALTILDSAGGSGPGTVGTEKQFFVVCNGTAWAIIQ